MKRRSDSIILTTVDVIALFIVVAFILWLLT